MSYCKYVHHFCCIQWNWILSKPHLRYQRDNSIGVCNFLLGGLWSEKIPTESEYMHDHTGQLHVEHDLMISLKQGSQMKNYKIPILANRKNFQMRYGRASWMIFVNGRIYSNFAESCWPPIHSSIIVFIWKSYNYVGDYIGLQWGFPRFNNMVPKRILVYSMDTYRPNNDQCESAKRYTEHQGFLEQHGLL